MKKRYFVLLFATVGCVMSSVGRTIPEGKDFSSKVPERAPFHKYIHTRDVAGGDDANAPVIKDIISEVDARRETYMRSGSGYFPYMGYVYYYDAEWGSTPSIIAFGEDNTIYFRDLMDFGMYDYVKGIIDGNKITVELPQTLFIEEYSWLEYPIYNILQVLVQEGSDSETNFLPDETVEQVTYTIADDGTITLDPLPEGYALGVMSYNYDRDYYSEDENAYTWYAGWAGGADFTQTFQPLGISMIEMPKNTEIQTYQVVINGYNYPVSVAFQDNYIYIQGLGDSEASSSFVVRGTIEDGKVIVPQNQYVGIFEWDNEAVVNKCGYQRGSYIIYEDDDVSFDFNIEYEGRFLSPVDPDLYFCFAYMRMMDNNTKQEGLLYNYYFKNFSLLNQDSYPGIPSNPYNLEYNKNSDWLGVNTMAFELQCISTEQHVILSGNLYYSLYLDDELVLFEYEKATELGEVSKYYLLPEPTTEIPFLFTNNFEFYIWDEIEREVGFYVESATTVGIQAVYYCDGVRTESDIVTMNVDTGEIFDIPAGVHGIEAEVVPAMVEYYDLSGKKVSNPQNGIYVKRITLTNGKVISMKVAIK